MNTIENSDDFSASQFRLPKGSLYSAFPIPAYQVLGRAREYQAQKVLLALTSYLGKGSYCVFPSYTTIARVSGMSRNSISKGLTVLYEYGFIKIAKYREGKESRRKYYLQPSCWDSSRMNGLAKIMRTMNYICLDCKEVMDRGGFGLSPLGKVHYGCGGMVISLETKNRAK